MAAMHTAARDSAATLRLSLTSTMSEKADSTVQQLIFDSVVPLNNHKTWLAWFNDYTVLQHFDAIGRRAINFSLDFIFERRVSIEN